MQATLKEHGVVSFDSKDTVNTFSMFFGNLADSLLQKLPPSKKYICNQNHERVL